jgi:hypothetical protein
MLIIIDKKIPQLAKQPLRKLAEVIELETSAITYDAISGHPDIFFCKTNDSTVITTPNLSDYYIDILLSNNINFIKGIKNIGDKYPASAHYNAVVTDDFLIHNTNFTDETILNHTKNKNIINVKQAYTRCNLLHLTNNSFITSDEGIYAKLKDADLNTLFVSPLDVELPGFKHGFFGGACGVYKNTVYVIGSLRQHQQGDMIKDFIYNSGLDIVELYDGKLYDGGSILFLD